MMTSAVVVTPPQSGSCSARVSRVRASSRASWRRCAPRAGVLAALGLRLGAGQGVEQAAEPFGEFGGAFAGEPSAPVRPLLQVHLAVPAPVFLVAQHPVRVEQRADPPGDRLQVLQVQHAGLLEQ
jgi:hypothetical protein